MINQRDSNRRRNAVIDENEARDENKKKETLQLKRRNMHRRQRFKTKKERCKLSSHHKMVTSKDRIMKSKLGLCSIIYA